MSHWSARRAAGDWRRGRFDDRCRAAAGIWRTALERVAALAEFDLFWLEAPMPHEPVEAYAELCARSPMRIACESAGDFWDSLPVASAEADLARRLAGHLQRRRHRRVETHQRRRPRRKASGACPICSAPASSPPPRSTPSPISRRPISSNRSEAGSPLNTDLVAPALRAVDGFIDLPPGPGLGVTLDEVILARYRVA